MDTTNTVAQVLENWITQDIYPNTLYDGGYLKFESFDGKTLTLGAYQECSTCIGCKDRLKQWLIQKAKQRFDVEIDVAYHCYIPYYK